MKKVALVLFALCFLSAPAAYAKDGMNKLESRKTKIEEQYQKHVSKIMSKDDIPAKMKDLLTAQAKEERDLKIKHLQERHDMKMKQRNERRQLKQELNLGDASMQMGSNAKKMKKEMKKEMQRKKKHMKKQMEDMGNNM
jgi:Skp family chaperone for outer membrane proteins